MSSRVEKGTFLESVQFNVATVIAAIKKLKSNLFSGPDNYFPPLLYKSLSVHVAKPLSMIFTSFFSVHQIPEVWSKSIFTPVFKTGSSCDPANYRPISLTCVACKLMERVIANQILSYLRIHTT